MVKNPTVKIPFLDEDVPSVTSRIFVHGIMLYLIELWTDGVGEIVRHSGKIKRTPSIVDWSTELLSGNKVFDEFLASGIISVMPTRLPPPPTDKWEHQASKANASDIYVAFVEWAKNLRKTKTQVIESDILIQKLQEPNKLKNADGKGFKLADNVFQYMKFDPSKIKAQTSFKPITHDDQYPSTEVDDFDTNGPASPDSGYNAFESGPEPQTKKTMTVDQMRSKLEEVKTLFDDNLINEHEYQEMRNVVMDAFRAVS